LRSGLSIGQLVKCVRCGEILALMTRTPPKFNWAFEEPDLFFSQTTE
jgi:hypothetical protein